MRQAEDTKTVDKHGEPKRGRGRPAGVVPALSAAERQRKRRERLRASEDTGFLTIKLDFELLAALDKFVQFKDESKSDVVARILRDRLLRKR